MSPHQNSLFHKKRSNSSSHSFEKYGTWISLCIWEYKLRNDLHSRSFAAKKLYIHYIMRMRFCFTLGILNNRWLVQIFSWGFINIRVDWPFLRKVTTDTIWKNEGSNWKCFFSWRTAHLSIFDCWKFGPMKRKKEWLF